LRFRMLFVLIIALSFGIANLPVHAADSALAQPVGVASPNGDSSSKNAATPSPPVIPFYGPYTPHVIYVLGRGTDAALRAKLVANFVFRMQRRGPYLKSAILVPQPDWALNDYVNMCVQDSEHTVGAFIVGLISSGTYAESHFITRTSWTKVSANVVYASCFPPLSFQVAAPTAPSTLSPAPRVQSRASRSGSNHSINVVVNIENSSSQAGASTERPVPKPTPFTAYVWQSPLEEGAGGAGTVQGLLALSYILSFASLYEVIAPSKTATTTSIRNNPTPSPYQSGYVSSVTSVASSTTNNSQIGTLSVGLLTQSLAYTSGINQLPTADLQGWIAAQHAIDRLVEYMKCPNSKLPFCGDASAANPVPVEVTNIPIPRPRQSG
jgi:hypothetical protein